MPPGTWAAQGITDGEALAMWDLACHSARREDIAAGLLAAERAGASSTMQDLRVLEGALLLLEGHADDAESRFVRFGSRIRAGEPVAAPWIDVSLALLHLHRGELDAARTALHGPASATEAAQTEYHAADRSAALGWLAWERGRWADAAEHLERSMRLWRTGCWHTLVGGPIFLPLHLDALLRQDRKADAAALLEQTPAADGQARVLCGRPGGGQVPPGSQPCAGGGGRVARLVGPLAVAVRGRQAVARGAPRRPGSGRVGGGAVRGHRQPAGSRTGRAGAAPPGRPAAGAAAARRAPVGA
jgi:hypothetical protein